MVTVLVEPLVEIVLSLGLGALAGWLLFRVEKYFYSRSKRLSTGAPPSAWRPAQWRRRWRPG
mgnify:CR=1 FL=1